MKKLELYLDTSVFSHLFHDDAPEKRDETRKFIAQIGSSSLYTAYTSAVTIVEVLATRDSAHRARLLDAVGRSGALLIQPSELGTEYLNLADAYLSRGALPPKSRADAMHVAIATVRQLDAVVNWNFKHMANIHREQRFIAISAEAGYLKRLIFITPPEAIDYDP